MILIDNTVLSNFAQANLLSLLHTYCQDLGHITQEVLAEFEKGRLKGLFAKNPSLDWLSQIKTRTPAEEVLFNTFGPQLNLGEAFCLAIAICRDGAFLSDDKDASKVALQSRVSTSGSIGVLLNLIEAKEITLAKGNEILQTFIKNGYYSSVNRLDEFI